MKSGKKEDDAITKEIKEQRIKIRKKIEKELLEKYKEYLSQGKFPWEGLWLKPEDIAKLQNKLKKRDKIVFIEVLILFFFLVLLSYGLYKLMLKFLLP
ncbi:MAG: hypothetical protein MRJ65_16880 [Candidatus Brocadiaceae bacterium]|nr:hypothetical protein [Candidatus Brocadiaceae bacterium]